MKKTKIICTLGPASCTAEVLKEMIINGMNVGRFNMSHGTLESHLALIEQLKRAREELQLPCAILIDTKGPEIRIRDFENGSIVLKDNQKFILTTEEVLGTTEKVSVTYKNLPSIVSKNTKVMVNDGQIELKVISTTKTEVVTKVVVGGVLSNKKSINLPDIDLDMPFISEQDKKNIEFACKVDADFLALSFVNKKEDVLEVKKLLTKFGKPSIKLISKIESNLGVKNAHEILDVSDGLMVARGDLGVEVDFTKLPIIQKQLIEECNAHGKLCVTATQMLESMTTASRPTRAEISDVANAIFDGTSAIMLSGETSAGKHPALVVSTMAAIAAEAETALSGDSFMMYQQEDPSFYNSLGYACAALDYSLKAEAICCATTTGKTAIAISNYKPMCPIVACTEDKNVYNMLSAYYGIIPVLTKINVKKDDLIKECLSTVKKLKIAKSGQNVILAFGYWEKQSQSNCILVEKL